MNTRSFGYQGDWAMTDNKLEILKLILENGNVEEAVRTVADIISCFSKQHESYQERVVVDQELIYQTNQGMW